MVSTEFRRCFILPFQNCFEERIWKLGAEVEVSSDMFHWKRARVAEIRHGKAIFSVGDSPPIEYPYSRVIKDRHIFITFEHPDGNRTGNMIPVMAGSDLSVQQVVTLALHKCGCACTW